MYTIARLLDFLGKVVKNYENNHLCLVIGIVFIIVFVSICFMLEKRKENKVWKNSEQRCFWL